jgi:acetyl-CoA C-acetyltransferase
MPRGIKGKVAILGMGCAKFGERWNCDSEQLMVEAYSEAIKDAGIETSRIDAAWLASAFDAVNIGPSGLPLAMALRLPNIAVTKVENYCASGTESVPRRGLRGGQRRLRHRLAMGVEKLKDTGYGGLPVRTAARPTTCSASSARRRAIFAQLASAYRAKHGVSKEDLKRAIAHVSVKSHANGAKNPKAHLRKPIDRWSRCSTPR